MEPFLVRSFELIISITWLKSHLNSATSFRSILTMSFIRVLQTVQIIKTIRTVRPFILWTLACKVERVVGYSDSGVILRCSIMSSRSKRIGVFGTQLRKAFLKSKIRAIRTASRPKQTCESMKKLVQFNSIFESKRMEELSHPIWPVRDYQCVRTHFTNFY